MAHAKAFFRDDWSVYSSLECLLSLLWFSPDFERMFFSNHHRLSSEWKKQSSRSTRTEASLHLNKQAVCFEKVPIVQVFLERQQW